jgi:hypothetical protein
MSVKTKTIVAIVLVLVLIGIIVPWVLVDSGGSPPAHGPTTTQRGAT